ncbi:substrate-binding domain-containing protein [Amycolatopsis sp. FDAARGOS 1241]|nr:substrate-binding domain-containing protein [Amycolatopsis sp. FDAARGOS 1241]
MAEATAAGVPVVTFDLDAPRSGRSLFVGMPEAVELGRQAGRLMTERVPAGPRILVQTGSAKAPGAVGKLRGFLEVTVQAGLEVVGGEDDGERIGLATANARAALAEDLGFAGCYGGYGYHARSRPRSWKTRAGRGRSSLSETTCCPRRRPRSPAARLRRASGSASTTSAITRPRRSRWSRGSAPRKR